MKNLEELTADSNENNNQTAGLEEYLKNMDIQSIIEKHIPKIDIAQFVSLEKGPNLSFFTQKTLVQQVNENPDLKNFFERTGAIHNEEKGKFRYNFGSF